jgi:hypothetical protein
MNSTQNKLSITLLIFTAFMIMSYYYWSISHICPVEDGNNCVSRASNIGLLLSRGQFAALRFKLQNDYNNFLSVSYFSFFSAIIGPGRIAWGWAWIVAGLSLILFQTQQLKTMVAKQQVILTFLLLLICSPILSQAGGLLDQRFDLFALLLLLAAITSLCSQRIVFALYLSIAAIYAKGPAVPIAITVWVSAWVTGIITFKQMLASFNKHKFALIGCVLLLICYKLWFLSTVVSYNLIAVKSADHSLVGIAKEFIFSSWRNIRETKTYYYHSLFDRAPFFLILLLDGIAILFFKTEKMTNQKKLVAWGLLLFSLSYLLFTAHPVKANVLDLWFLPSLWMLAFVLSGQIEKNRLIYNVLLVVITLRLLFIAYMVTMSGPSTNPNYQQYYQSMRTQAHSISVDLAERPTLSKQVIRLLPNFLSSPETGICFCYDTYRVLLFEALGRNAPILEGWELGTFSNNWWDELAYNDPHELLLAMIVTEGKDKIHFRSVANQLGAEYIAKANPVCKLNNIQGTEVPDFGKFQFFLTTHKLSECF